MHLLWGLMTNLYSHLSICILQGSGRVQSLFVEAMVKENSTEKDMQVWQTILHNVYNTLKQTSFTDATALQSKLFALDVIFRMPLLQGLLVGSPRPACCCSLVISVAAHRM